MTRRFLLPIVLAVLLAAVAACPAHAAAGTGIVWKQHLVRSPASGKIERFWVGHSNALDPKGSYPAIYFLPGLLDGDDNWKKALQPHLARHEIVAVCTSVGGATWFMNSTEHPWMRWGDFLTRELPAFIEATYPVSSQKGQRGVAGISAGGHAALYHALTHPNLYGSVTVLSGAVDLRGYLGAPGLDVWLGGRTPDARQRYADRSCAVLAAKQTAPLPFALALEVGDKDGTLRQMDPLHRLLTAKGIAHQWTVSPGGHSWTLWSRRAGDVLTWHASQFALNRRKALYPEEPPTTEPALEVLAKPPAVDLSDEARTRLRAPWAEAGGDKAVKTSGIPAEGAPLRKDAKKGDPFAETSFSAAVPVTGFAPGLFVYRLTLTLAAPLPKAGAVTLRGRFRNARKQDVIGMPAAALPVPAGAPQRQVTLRARVAVEIKAPGLMRGGILMAVQPFDADGQPAGDPVVGQACPGTIYVERWPLGPRAGTLWTVSLTGDDALPLAAVHEARLCAEPPAP